MSRGLLSTAFLLFPLVSSLGQPSTHSVISVAVSDPQAVALVQEAQLALTNGLQVADVTLNGSASWTAGSTHEIGSAALQAKGTGEARLDISAGPATRSEIRNDSDGPAGLWRDAAGITHPLALHNCWTPGAWFAPQSVIQVLQSLNSVLRYLGRETVGGIAVDHVQEQSLAPKQPTKMAAVIQKLSTVDVFLAADTHLPVLIQFNSHPDDDLLQDIPVAIHFSNYQNVNGIAVPFHLQRFFHGTLQLDVTITSAAFNSGISDSNFALQ